MRLRVSISIRMVGLALVTGLISACGVTIDESVAFQPQPTPFAKATTPDELQQNWLTNARGTNWQTQRTVSLPGPGVVRIVPDAAAATALVGFDARFGFLGDDDRKVAFTRFTPLREITPGEPLIVICGGNATDRYNSGVSYAQKALPWGEVFHFDYPGYGDSGGETTAADFQEAASRVRGEAMRVADGRPIILWGHSLGGFVCGAIADGLTGLAGIIFETSAASAADVAREWTPEALRWIVRPRVSPSLASYNNVQAGVRADVPVLVLGAGQDNVLPPQLARGLARGLEEAGADVRYVEFPAAEHWNVPNQPDFKVQVDQFFKSLKRNQP
jgi:pimeloyl-ACP methyl ester carboxylesterase